MQVPFGSSGLLTLNAQVNRSGPASFSGTVKHQFSSRLMAEVRFPCSSISSVLNLSEGAIGPTKPVRGECGDVVQDRSVNVR